MAVDYTTTALLASIRRRGMFASGDDALSDVDLLAIASEEQLSYIVPVLLAADGEFLVSYKDVSLTATTNELDVPDRAHLNRIRDVLVQSSSRWVQLQYVEPELADMVTSSSGYPVAWTFRGDKVVVLPSGATGTVRLKYYRRPSDLVLPSTCALVTAVTVGGGGGSVDSYTTASIPSGLVSGLVDAVSLVPPFSGAFESLTVTNGGAYVGVNSTQTGYTRGTAPLYLCPEKQTCIPQIPYDLVPLLAQRTAVVAMEAVGDPKFRAAEDKLEKMEEKAVASLTPRQDGTARVVINRYGPGWRR